MANQNYECPKCRAKVDTDKNKYGETGNSDVFAMLGMSNIQLKCPSCGTIFEVTD